MLTIFSLILLLLILKIKKSTFLIFFGLNFILFSIVVDGLFLGYFEDQFDYGEIKLNLSLFYIWVSYLFAFIIFSIVINRDKKVEDIYIPKNYTDILIFFTISVSFFATIINILRAGNPMQVFLTPRIWEINFGRYPLLNYLYFLHIVSGFIALVQYKIYKKKIYLFIFILSVILSVFHGIKMSIAHAIIIPSFAFFILNNYKLNRFVYRAGIIFLCIILFFFIFIRGGGLDGFFGYFTSGSINAIYKIQKTELLLNSPIGTIIPDISSMLGWMWRRLSESEFVSNNPGVGFILNEKYNTFHPISDSYFTTFSFFLMPLFLAIVINLVKKRKYVTITNLFVESFLLYSCFMFFWSWIFWQIKILYLIFFLFTSHLFYKNILLKKTVSIHPK